MNDCKYDHDIHNGVVRLTLIKSATMPNPAADKEIHHFTYALYPHMGDYRQAGTIQTAYLLNNPMTACPVAAQQGSLKDCYSLVSTDRENIFVEAVKEAEDSDALIVRLYDAYDMRSRVHVNFGFEVAKAEYATILEEPEAEIPVSGNSVCLDVKPFEIVTLKITRK